MILVEFTPSGGSLYRISLNDVALEYQWFGYIKSLSSIKFALPTRHGGYARPEFSQMELSPNLMAEIGSYPATATVRIVETESNETAGAVIFDGGATLVDYGRHGFVYKLTKPHVDVTIASGTAYADTLTAVAGTLCTAMGLTLDDTAARSPSPAVDHTTASDQLALDLLSDMCAFFSHGFTIKGAMLYLYDMLTSETATVLTEFDTQACNYRREPYSLFKASDTESLDGSDSNGAEYSVTPYHGTSENIQAALADIKTIMESSIAVMRWKVDKDKPIILGQVEYTDESLILPVDVFAKITNIIYNFDTLSVEAVLTGSVVERQSPPTQPDYGIENYTDLENYYDLGNYED